MTTKTEQLQHPPARHSSSTRPVDVKLQHLYCSLPMLTSVSVLANTQLKLDVTAHVRPRRPAVVPDSPPWMTQQDRVLRMSRCFRK